MSTLEIIKLILLIIGSYFVGNISFARIISKNKEKKDITKSGSGNPGSMNMLRTFGFKIGLLTLVCDVIKGAVPSLCGLLLFGFNTTMGTVALYSAGLSTIIGHIYPVCYKFKGGKGIACTLGVFLVADPLWLSIFFVFGFLYLWFFDYGSVASLTIVTALTIIEGVKNYGNLTISILLFCIFLFTWFAHRNNLNRLLIGQENKANLQKSIKKKFTKQKGEIRQEYKETKSEIKKEYKTEKQKYKEDRQKYLEEREKYQAEKRQLKTEYKNNKNKVYNYANVVSIVESKDEMDGKDNE